MLNLVDEIEFQTTRSGGKGGQNVNKVETAVIGYFNVNNSKRLSEEQKQLVLQKLSNRINKEGQLVVRSQSHRTQLANKEDVTDKINTLIEHASHKKIPRIATKISRAAKEKRLESKKKHSERKAGRRRMDFKNL